MAMAKVCGSRMTELCFKKVVTSCSHWKKGGLSCPGGAIVKFKGALSGLRQFLAIENPLKMMKDSFYFTSRALFVLKIFKCLSWPFGHVAK